MTAHQAEIFRPRPQCVEQVLGPRRLSAAFSVLIDKVLLVWMHETPRAATPSAVRAVPPDSHYNHYGYYPRYHHGFATDTDTTRMAGTTLGSVTSPITTKG